MWRWAAAIPNLYVHASNLCHYRHLRNRLRPDLHILLFGNSNTAGAGMSNGLRVVNLNNWISVAKL
jgi:hypothetical protein